MNYPPSPASPAPAAGSSYIPLNDELNQLVLRYRTGDRKAGEELISRFQPLIRKYRTALWLGKIPDYDPDMGRFLSFFNRDKRKAVELLSKSIHKDEPEDLEQILSFCLLETARKYNKISAGFKFTLKDYLTKLTKDASNHRTTITVDFSDESAGTRGRYKFKYPFKHDTELVTKHQDTVNEAVRFVTEGSDVPGFVSLTLEERRICKMVFIDGHGRPHVAAHLNITDRQMRRKIGKIRAKLKTDRPSLQKETDSGDESDKLDC